MNHQYIIFSLLLISSSTISPAEISVSSQIKSTIGALGCAVGGGIVAQKINKRAQLNSDLFVLFSTLVTGYLGWKLFFRCTPEGKIERAKHCIVQLDKNMLATLQFKSHDVSLLLDALHKMYISQPFPYVQAFYAIQDLRTRIMYAQDLLYDAITGCQLDSVYWLECNQLIKDSCTILPFIEHALTTISHMPDWSAMMNGYQSLKALEVQREILQQMQINAMQPRMTFIHSF